MSCFQEDLGEGVDIVTEESPTVTDPLPPRAPRPHALAHHDVVLALSEEQLVLSGAASASDLAPCQRKVVTVKV